MRFARKQIGQLELLAKRIKELHTQWEANVGECNPGYETLSNNVMQAQKTMHEQIGKWSRSG
ncbi:hypothetical protein [Citrobacter sp. Cpo150]|nr:hypothetical protein [Citrobacter sp. Cpo150]MDM2765744.1 hypothetical protein [Citrobacter sp. Cpo150]